MTWKILLVVGGLLSALPAAAQITQERATVSAGGGTLTSSQYTLTGTIGQASPVGVLSNATLTIQAGFWHGAAPMAFTLTLKKRGTGSGVVTGPGIDCGADCAERYAAGTTLDLAAAPDPCSRFVRWEDAAGQPLISPLTISANLTVAAVFEACCPAPVTSLSPPNGAANQPLDATLTWQAADGASSYDVYWGAGEPLVKQTTTLGLQYAPVGLTLNTAYHWRVDAVNSCGETPGTVWSFITANNTNHAPIITSTPPAMTERIYRYHVKATDVDEDILTFSLLTKPDSMTIQADTGTLVWQPIQSELGKYSILVQVADGHGGTATQSFELHLAADLFTTMTVKFLDGVNIQAGTTEHDRTVLSLSQESTWDNMDDLLLPDVPNLLNFSGAVSFYFSYQRVGSKSMALVPVGSLSRMAFIEATSNMAYEEIQFEDISNIAFASPATCHVINSDMVIIQLTDGRYFKIGRFEMMPAEGSVKFSYQELTP